MAVAKSLDKTRFLYTEHTDNTVSSVKMMEKLRPLCDIRVPKASNPDFATALASKRVILDKAKNDDKLYLNFR